MIADYMWDNGFYNALERIGIIPVVVLDRAENAIPVADALVNGGLPAAEVTFRTDSAADCIKLMNKSCPDILVGAGTVINVEQAKRAVDSGAKFIVSPGTDLETVDWCLENHVSIVPAAVTPTELMTLINRGIHVTKFFPANLYGGIPAMEALASVFIGHRFMPTGGVSIGNVEDYLNNPTIIAAGGTWMVKPGLFADGDFSKVERLSTEASAIVLAHRA